MRLPKSLSCTEKLVLLYIATRGEGEYSVSSLAKALSLSRRAVHVALRHLTSLDLVEILEYPRGRRGGIYRAKIKALEDSI